MAFQGLAYSIGALGLHGWGCGFDLRSLLLDVQFKMLLDPWSVYSVRLCRDVRFYSL